MASTLSAGDIAIIGYLAGGNASSSQPDESSFSFITFTNLDPGTDIYFTNNAWTGSNFNGVTPTTLNFQPQRCSLHRYHGYQSPQRYPTYW